MAVAQARSFTAAAARLGMSRANVTKQISALERQLGVQLLNRNTQHVAPTKAGLLLDKGTCELCWNLGDAVIRRRSVLACW